MWEETDIGIDEITSWSMVMIKNCSILEIKTGVYFNETIVQETIYTINNSYGDKKKNDVLCALKI